MPAFQHYGLYFTPQHIAAVVKNRQRPPLAGAWARLRSRERHGGIAGTLHDALFYRLDGAVGAGEGAVVALQNGLGLDDASDTLETLMQTAGLAHCFELVRDHPAFPPDAAEWLNRFAGHLARLDSLETPYPGILWRGLVNVTAGVVLEDEDRLQTGAEIYRQAVQNDIRPEGYLPSAVEGGDGGSLYRQLLSVAALALMAEAASHVGLDLWGYAWRGISITTAALYLVYYYYYPDQWRWDSLPEGESARLFGEYGAFLELINRRAPIKDARLMFDDLRPFWSPLCGGMTTLTHAVPTRRGWFA